MASREFCSHERHDLASIAAFNFRATSDWTIKIPAATKMTASSLMLASYLSYPTTFWRDIKGSALG